ncbi:MAG: hypothetical protein ACOCRX_11715 [Candidatus Woesearchaeota archaeon]
MPAKNEYKKEFKITDKEDLESIVEYLEKIRDKTVNYSTTIDGKKYKGIGELIVEINIKHYIK